MESGVHSYYVNFHHHITFAKLNLKIHYPPPPPPPTPHPLMKGKFWHYQKANFDQIRQAISEFPQDNRFTNISAIEQVNYLRKSFKNIIYNIISNTKYITSYNLFYKNIV